MTKTADGLIDAKLVLCGLVRSLGLSAAITCLFGSIRDADAFVPQVLMAGEIAVMVHRKWAWVIGALGQGAMAAVICLSAVWLEGRAVGFAIAGAL